MPAEGGAPLSRVALEGPGVRVRLQLGEATPAGQALEAAAEVEGSPPVCRVVRLEPASEAALVSAELAMAGRDLVYEAALRAAARP